MGERTWPGVQAALTSEPQASGLRNGVAGRVTDNLTTAWLVRLSRTICTKLQAGQRKVSIKGSIIYPKYLSKISTKIHLKRLVLLN